MAKNHAELEHSGVWTISSRYFVAACIAAALGILWLSRTHTFSSGVLAAEIFGTIIGLFVFGSFRIRIHKNALAYGMAAIILATFFGSWWPSSGLRTRFESLGWSPVLEAFRKQCLTWHGLDGLIHIDTMMFILGLTLFVAVIAQTRLLETIAFALLRKNRGSVLPTVIAVTAVVAVFSGILDGVSMIGLTIRTLVLILFLARAPVAVVRYSIVVCTVVTTVCGIWLAYGEPPNLIMKSNLTAADGTTYLNNTFFLRYCLPAAIASYLVVAWSLRRRLKGTVVQVGHLDILDSHAERLRFLQATNHGEVLTPIEVMEEHESEFEVGTFVRVMEREQKGEPLGLAMVKEGVPEPLRRKVLGKFVVEDLAPMLDQHYCLVHVGDSSGARRAEVEAGEAMRSLVPLLSRAQRFGIGGMFVFVGILLWHAWDHRVPLFAASFAGFAVSLCGIARIPKMRGLAFREAKHEFGEYYFLFPLFLSVSLLSKVGFFEQLQSALHSGTAQGGVGPMAISQFLGCTLLSALLDNNVVADFGSHAIHGFELANLHLFAMAQICGYAIGGCWTHIGSAQSVVAFAFIRKDVERKYTPVQWIKDMTPIVLEISLVLAALIYAESLLLEYLQ